MIRFGKQKKEKLDVEKINDSVNILNTILKITFILLVVLLIYVFTLICKEWKILTFFKTILSVCTPLFIGFVIAWLFNPFVTALQKKGVKRILGTTLVYSILFLLIVVFFWALIPNVVDEFTDLGKVAPKIVTGAKDFVTNSIDSLDRIKGLDLTTTKTDFLKSIEKITTSISVNLPKTFIKWISSFLSGASVFLISLIIGFYFLLNFDGTTKHFVSLLPSKNREEITSLIEEISVQLFKYVKGVVIISTGIFVISAIGFSLIGMKAPILFALLCGVTNIIPYVGPYLGGVPAVLVAFTTSNITGILAFAIVFVVQLIEGNILQPVVMSKTMKLHPVTIIIGLLVFGYFFGIAGMILATPIISLLKILYKYFKKKYDEKLVEEQE